MITSASSAEEGQNARWAGSPRRGTAGAGNEPVTYQARETEAKMRSSSVSYQSSFERFQRCK
jgi:hypothetical protein